TSTTSVPSASSTFTTLAVARARPPACPRLAIERMKMPSSRNRSRIRMRSPRMAPPLNGLDGSTATIATRATRSRYNPARRLTSVDLPPPGGQVPLDREVLQIPVPAEDLQRRVDGPRRGLRRVQLRLRGRVREAQPGIGERGRAMHEQTGRIELGLRASEAPLDHLELGDRLTELLALLRVADRGFERCAPEPD